MSKQQVRLTLSANAGAGNGTAYEWPGGKGMFMAEATWGGGNVKLQQQSANATWIDVAPSSTLSANGMVVLDLPPGQVRVVITTSTAVYSYLVGIPQ